MIKKIIKILSVILLLLVLAIFYLSYFGIKTERFNDQIINKFLKINKKVNLNLNEINYLLNPYNFTINIKTENPQILLEGNKLEIKKIKTNVSLKSLINDQFSIDDLQITTKEIKVNDIIALLRVFKNSPKLFILNTIIKDGFVIANINLNFDEKGNIKEDYKVAGSIKKLKINTKKINKVLKKLNKIDSGKYQIYKTVNDIFTKSISIIDNCNNSCDRKQLLTVIDSIDFTNAILKDFESDIVKAHLSGSAIIGTALGPCSPGSAYVLLVYKQNPY